MTGEGGAIGPGVTRGHSGLFDFGGGQPGVPGDQHRTCSPSPVCFGCLNQLALRDDGGGLPVLKLGCRRWPHPSCGKGVLPDLVGQRGQAASKMHLGRKLEVASRV